MYCFRVRFRLTGSTRISLSEPEVILAEPPSGKVRVVLFGYGRPPVPIATTNHLVVEGSTYASDYEARLDAERWRAVLQRALAAAHIGADFGDWGPTSVLTDAGARAFSQHAGQPVVNDVHGVATFECDPRPVFITGSATATVGRAGDRVLRLIALANQSGEAGFDDRYRTACNLFGASIGLEPADARFVMLMMAVETLIEPRARPDASRALVNQLITAAKDATIEKPERESILGSLRWLLDESISQAGRRLAKTLRARSYAGQSPERFFTHCYTIRSSLVHGGVPRPPFETISGVVAELERFVRDLIVGDLVAAVENPD